MTDFTTTLTRHAPRRSFSVLQYFDLYRQRRALASLDEDGLRDIGLSRADATQEAARPIWDAPAHWS